jgi:DNA-binding NarL/FixJ family response regulator
METGTTRVLIADRLEPVRAGLRLLLSQAHGLTVAGEASTAEGVVMLTNERKPDLVLLEWGLPGSQSSAVVRNVRAARPEMPVIALSANPEVAREALDAGADAFVSKLDPPERLLAAMHDCVAKHSIS